jgi:uncharacterized DUF497 family protein
LAHYWLDHGVTFAMAREAFKDAFAIEWTDARGTSAEERYVMLAHGGKSPVVCRLHPERGKNTHHLSPEG